MKKDLKEMVLVVLRDDQETRNSDIKLTHVIWQRYYGVGDTIRLSQMYDLPREDNVKRIRAKIQNEEKLYPPTEWKIAKARGFKEQEWRDLLGYLPKGEEGNATVRKEKEMDKLFDIKVDYRW